MTDPKLNKIAAIPGPERGRALGHLVALWGPERADAHFREVVVNAWAQVAYAASPPVSDEDVMRKDRDWLAMLGVVEPIAELEILSARLAGVPGITGDALAVSPGEIRQRAAGRVLDAVVSRHGYGAISGRLDSAIRQGRDRIAGIDASLGEIADSQYLALGDQLTDAADLLRSRGRIASGLEGVATALKAINAAVAVGASEAIGLAGGASVVVPGLAALLEPEIAPAKPEAAVRMEAEIASIDARLIETPDGWVGVSLRKRREELAADLAPLLRREEPRHGGRIAVIVNRAIDGAMADVQGLATLLKSAPIDEAQQLRRDLERVLADAVAPHAVAIFEAEEIVAEARKPRATIRAVAA